MRERIDETDLHILKELQADGRLSNVDLSQRIGMSPPPCLRRVRALEESGYITGYRAELDSKKLGFDVSCFAFVQLASQAGADLALFEKMAQGCTVVRECWKLSGEFDFVLMCMAPDLTAFQAFVGVLTSAPNVRNVRTSLVLDKIKHSPGVPL